VFYLHGLRSLIHLWFSPLQQDLLNQMEFPLRNWIS
jgi:hypothetical protein